MNRLYSRYNYCLKRSETSYGRLHMYQERQTLITYILYFSTWFSPLPWSFTSATLLVLLLISRLWLYSDYIYQVPKRSSWVLLKLLVLQWNFKSKRGPKLETKLNVSVLHISIFWVSRWRPLNSERFCLIKCQWVVIRIGFS